MKNKIVKFPIIRLLFLLFICGSAASSAFAVATYTSVQNGLWASASTWSCTGGPCAATPPNIVDSATEINVRHFVQYNLAGSLNNNGKIVIMPGGGSTDARLLMPVDTVVTNTAPSPRGFWIIDGSYLQCQFGTAANLANPVCAISGTGSGGAGVFNSVGGGYLDLTRANFEVASDLNIAAATSVAYFEHTCVRTGGSFAVQGGTVSIVDANMLVGAGRNVGSFLMTGGQTQFSTFKVQIAGATGDFDLDAGTAFGDIDLIKLRTLSGGVVIGKIRAGNLLNTATGLNLDAFCPGSLPNQNFNRFTGTKTLDCGLNVFATECLILAPSAAPARISGQVRRFDGAPIGRALVEVHGGSLTTPVIALTNGFGFYSLDVYAGETYIITVSSKMYSFETPAQLVTPLDDVTNLDFVAQPIRGLGKGRSVRR